MPRATAFHPITIAGDTDSEGRLVMIDGRLAGVLLRLDDELHGEHRGGWFVEAAFGCLSEAAEAPVFGTLEEAAQWIERHMEEPE